MSIERIRVDETSYSDIVVVAGEGRLIHVAGQLAFDDHRRIVGDDVTAQAHRCLDRIDALLGRVGAGLPNVIRITTLLIDLDDYSAFDAVRAIRFDEHRPASTAYQVAALLFGALIEIEAVAFLPGRDQTTPTE